MGDPLEEVEEVCARLYPRLVGALSLYCRDGHVAEDLAQETLVRLWERWSSIRRRAAVEAWAYRTGINLANSRFRRLRVERKARARVGAEIAEDEDVTAVLAVRTAIARLPKRQREAVILRFYAALSIEETAGVMGCAAGTVKAHLHKAIESLRAAQIIEDLEVNADA